MKRKERVENLGNRMPEPQEHGREVWDHPEPSSERLVEQESKEGVGREGPPRGVESNLSLEGGVGGGRKREPRPDQKGERKGGAEGDGNSSMSFKEKKEGFAGNHKSYGDQELQGRVGLARNLEEKVIFTHRQRKLLA